MSCCLPNRAIIYKLANTIELGFPFEDYCVVSVLFFSGYCSLLRVSELCVLVYRTRLVLMPTLYAHPCAMTSAKPQEDEGVNS